MILTGQQIIKEVRSGGIVISPFSEEQVNPNSYNYRLGAEYVELDEDYIYDIKEGCTKFESKKIPEEGLLLKPGKLYLCTTKEIIGSDKFVTSLIGKSSMGRLGLFLQLSADLGHQRQIHKWTLEIRACNPIKIYANMIIGQVTFWKVKGEVYEREGYYTLFNTPQISRGVRE